MKVVSLLVFAVALVGTWYLSRHNSMVSESVHMGIQNDLRNIITEYVEKNLPQSQNLRFEKLWTETVKKDKVTAHFMYSFEDSTQGTEPARVQVNGTAVLNKVSETPQMATWSFDELKILDNEVTFTEPVQISAGAGELEKEAKPLRDK